MKTKLLAAALIVAVVNSTAALAAPKNRDTTGYQPGQWFNCVVLIPGPTRTGPCWVDQLNGG